MICKHHLSLMFSALNYLYPWRDSPVYLKTKAAESAETGYCTIFKWCQIDKALRHAEQQVSRNELSSPDPSLRATK